MRTHKHFRGESTWGGTEASCLQLYVATSEAALPAPVEPPNETTALADIPAPIS